MFILSLFARIYTKIFFVYNSDHSFIRLEIRLFAIKIVRKDIPIVLTEGDDTSSPLEQTVDQTPNGIQDYIDGVKNFKKGLGKLLNAKPVLYKVLAKVHVHEFYWLTRYGTGDASTTGMLGGVLWSVKGFFSGFVKNHMNLINPPRIQVVPLFQQQAAFVELQCMFSMRVGQTIYAIIQILKVVRGN